MAKRAKCALPPSRCGCADCKRRCLEAVARLTPEQRRALEKYLDTLPDLPDETPKPCQRRQGS